MPFTAHRRGATAMLVVAISAAVFAAPAAAEAAPSAAVARPGYTVVAAIPGTLESGHYALDVAIDPVLRKAYVGSVSGIDLLSLRTNTVVKPIAGVGNVSSIAIDPISRRAYAQESGSLREYNVNNDTRGRRFDQFVVSSGRVAVDAITHDVYVTEPQTADVGILQPRTGEVTTVGTGYYSRGIAVDSVRHRAFIANSFSSDYPDDGARTVAVVDGRSRQLIATVPVAAPPTTVAVDLLLGKAIVDTGSITVIDAATNTVSATVPRTSPTGYGARSSAVDQTLHLAYLPDGSANTITVFDTRANRVVATIPTTAAPVSVDVDQLTHRVYVVGDDGSLTVLARN
jgi:hypothetical protein